MKTKTTGGTIYIVKKYYKNANGELQCLCTSWRNKKYAFEDCNKWRAIWGDGEAHVFKCKQCIEVGE